MACSHPRPDAVGPLAYVGNGYRSCAEGEMMMAKVSGYRCECGKQKTEANRWMLGRIIYSGRMSWAALSTWNGDEADRETVLVFCSDFCALKWQAEILVRMGR